MVVLDELDLGAGQPGKLAGVEGLEKKTSAVAEDLGFDDQHFGEGSGYHVHRETLCRLCVMTLAGRRVLVLSRRAPDNGLNTARVRLRTTSVTYLPIIIEI